MAKATVNIEELAHALGVSRITIEREIGRGKLIGARVGRMHVFTLPDIARYLGSEERAQSIFDALATEKGLESKGTIEYATKYLGIAPVIKQFGQWAVTEDGVECLEQNYYVEKSRLWEGDWKEHMKGKPWVITRDFDAALDYAREHFSVIQPN